MARLRLLIVLSVLSIVGILAVQAVWVRNAYALRDRQFRQSAFIALQDVADEVARLNRFTLNRYAVTQLSADYFIVNTDAPIDPVTLETFIQRSLQQHHLVTDFEYGIYNCETDRMVYGAYVSTGGTAVAKTKNLPKFSRYTYYFGIRFPNQSGFVAGQLSGWLWSTVAVLLVVGFFGYTLIVVLKQRRLTEVQRDFINNITHELQTPVSTIRIAADVLQSATIAQQPDRIRQYARVLSEESQRLQYQINSVLQLARATHGQATRGPVGRTGFSLDKTTIDLHEIMGTAAKAFAPHVTLDLNAHNPLVHAHRYQLETALNNLIDNAIKYSSASARVVLHTRQSAGRLIWSVRDNGIGIAPMHQKAVFKQFFRVPTNHTTNVGGFGLGLYYVWQVARAHGWQLSLISEPGRGSTFTLSEPVLLQHTGRSRTNRAGANEQRSHWLRHSFFNHSMTLLARIRSFTQSLIRN